MIFALDTNAASDALGGRGRVASRLLAVGADSVLIPALVVYELERGALARGYGAARTRHLKNFLSDFDVAPFDNAAALHAADIEATLRSAGQPMGLVDTLIAGISRSRGLTLVTDNTREFSRVASLLWEDWR